MCVPVYLPARHGAGARAPVEAGMPAAAATCLATTHLAAAAYWCGVDGLTARHLRPTDVISVSQTHSGPRVHVALSGLGINSLN